MKSLVLDINSKTLMDHSKTEISYAIHGIKETKVTIQNTLDCGKGEIFMKSGMKLNLLGNGYNW